MGPKRRLVYHFLDLPHVVRHQVLAKLGLSVEGDLGYEEGYAPYFRRAEEKGVLDQLWAAVERQHGVNPLGENPFSNGAA